MFAALALKSPPVSPSKAFEVGTTGWTAADLDDPAIDLAWDNGRYEIVEGVLTQMAAALAAGSSPTGSLIAILKNYFWDSNLEAEVLPELDLILKSRRVLRPDFAVMLPDDIKRAAASVPVGADWRYRRVIVPPTLNVETISRGHEDHDRVNKRLWYAEFGVPFFWLMDPADRSLESLALRDGEYHTVGRAAGDADIALPPFEGLTIPLKRVFGTS